MPDRLAVLEDEAGSSLRIEFSFEQPDEEGWIPFQLSFRRGDTTLAGCKEEILNKDLEKLAQNLRATTAPGDRKSWAPVEPSFLVWTYKHPSGSIDITVMIDDGVATGAGTTDTGVALVLNVSPESLEDFAGKLTA